MLIKFSITISSSCVSICSVSFGCGGVSIVIFFLFILVSVFLFFSIWCVGYCIRVLLWFFIYFLVHFKYFKVRNYRLNLASESLACCRKSSVFFSDFYHTFPTSSLCWVVSKITEKCKLTVFPRPFSVLVFGGSVCAYLGRRSCTWKKKKKKKERTANIDRMMIRPPPHVGYQRRTCRPWHPDRLTGSHFMLYFDFSFLS